MGSWNTFWLSPKRKVFDENDAETQYDHAL